MGLRAYLKNPPELGKRLAYVFMAFIILPILAYPFLVRSRYSSGSDPIRYILGEIYLVDIGTALIFIMFAFMLLSRHKLAEIKRMRFVRWQVGLFSALAAASLAGYLYLRHYTSMNAPIVWSQSSTTMWFSIGILASLASLLIFIVLASFNTNYLITIVRKCKTQIALSIGFFAGYLLITQSIKSLWLHLSTAVATCEYWLLNWVGDATLKTNWPDDPILGINGFVVRVGKDCSGIDSMAMFTALFLLVLAVEWNRIRLPRMLALFIPGLIGMFAVNVIRILLLMLSGIIVSPSFAIGLFHSNAGWLLFVIYFILFWHLMLPWVRR